MPCSNCGHTGHNMRTCPRSARPQNPYPRRCGACRCPGHTRSGCPLLGITRAIMRRVSENPSVDIRFDSFYGYNRLSNQQRDMLHRMNRWTPHATSIVAYPRQPDEPSPEPVFMRDLTPPPVKVDKKSMPKHISDQIWELNEPDCQICLGKVEKDDYKLSPCGHHFCSTCFKDVRLDKCGECRTPLTVVV